MRISLYGVFGIAGRLRSPAGRLLQSVYYEAMTSVLIGIPDTYYDGQGDTLSTLDLGLCDVSDVDIGLGFKPIVYRLL